MPTIKYSNNPNSDTAFVVQDGGQKNRAVLTAEPAGTLQLSDSANVSTGYVTDEDGKKHKVNLVAQLEGEVEFSENPNSTKGYVTVDSKKHRVVLTASLHGGGGEPINNQDKTITANGSYTADEGYTGLGTVTVNVPNPSTGTKTITANGTYDVTDFASADVNVPTTAPAHYLEFNVVNGRLSKSSKSIDLNGVDDIGDNTFFSMYGNMRFDANTKIDMSGLQRITGTYACYRMFGTGLGGLISVDLSNVSEITGANACQQMFYRCQRDEVDYFSVDLSSLKKVSGERSCNNMFEESRLQNINLDNLTIINGNESCHGMFLDAKYISNINVSSLTTILKYEAARSLFARTTSLTSIDFSSLKIMDGNLCGEYLFLSDTNLTTVNFPAFANNTFGSTYTSQLKNFVQGITGCTIHFPKNLDPQSGSTTISSLQTYPSFGGTNTVLMFDLPSTNHLISADTVEYERNPKYDTQTALAWRVKDTGTTSDPIIDWTPFYTSTLNDPVVGDTIYSDAACTTAVTTISSIA